MLTRRRHKLRPILRRRAHPDDFDPQVLVGPVFLFPRTCERADLWDEAMPRRMVNGRWLPGLKASHIEWVSRISTGGRRRRDPRIRKQDNAAVRCQLYRHTSVPF